MPDLATTGQAQQAAWSKAPLRWLNARSDIIATTSVKFTADIKAGRFRRPCLSAQEDISLALLLAFRPLLGSWQPGLSGLIDLLVSGTAAEGYCCSTSLSWHSSAVNAALCTGSVG